MQNAIKQTISPVKQLSGIALQMGVCSLALTSCQGNAPPPITVSSADIANGQTIARDFTADGANLSPSITWSSPGDQTKSFALIVDDPDAPDGDWIHWVVYDIPATEKALAKGLPKDALLSNATRQGKNSFRRIGYGGPQPPPGKLHHYYFTIYALDIKGLPNGLDAKQLEKSMEGHIVGSGKLMGTYERIAKAK